MISLQLRHMFTNSVVFRQWLLRKTEEDLLDISRKIADGLFWIPD